MFSDPLFVRAANGMVPTPRAHSIVRAARSHLEQLQDELEKSERFDPSVTTRPITLAISDVAEVTFFPALVERVRRYAPHCAVTTVLAPDEQLAIGLERGEIDVAAGYHPTLARRSFQQRAVAKHGFACLMRAGHPLASGLLSMAAYLESQHVVVRPEGRSQAVLEQFLERHRLERKVAVLTSHVLSVPFILMKSELLATLPAVVARRFASLTSTVVVAEPPFDVTYDFGLYWHRRFDSEPRNLWIRKQLTAVLNDSRWRASSSATGSFPVAPTRSM
jgi:DNA-binding transcriptional LysR family regulator